MEIKDVLGVGPVAEAGKRVVDSALDAASAFLSRICLPASEEFGLLLRDKVKAWRASNALKIAVKAEHLHAAIQSTAETHAHPRLVGQIIEHGSWSDSEEVQTMWAGLLASSCTIDGQDESNLMFIDLLSRLTVSQVRIIDHGCKTARVRKVENGLLYPDDLTCTLDELKAVSLTNDLHRLDRELDHLLSIGLLSRNRAGFHIYQPHTVYLTPSPLALQMYTRCNGVVGDPTHYYARLGTLITNEPAG
jgi:hypothetical protein